MTTAKSLGRVWAETPKDPIRDPGESKYALGWVAEIPTYQVLNFLHNRIDTNILALAERGVFEWGADIDYKKNALCWDETDGRIYVSTVANPSKLLTPSQNPSQWTASSIQIPASHFQQLANSINAHLTDYGNPHKISAAQLSAYTKAQIDTLVANLQTELNTHKAASNPHGTDADDVGAVPITGGRYTGTVYHDSNILGVGANTTNAVQAAYNKLFFKKGTLELGLDESGEPYFYDGTKQYLLNEELFLTIKKGEEVNYAVPLPDLLCNFMNDINVYAGTGPTAFSSTVGLPYVNKEGNTVTAAIDEPRVTQYGIALRGIVDALNVSRINDGYGFTSFTDAFEAYVNPLNDGLYVDIMISNGFLQNVFRMTGNTLDFIYWNGGNYISTRITEALSAGRHIFATTFNGSTKTISAYVDGVKVYSAGTTVPARTNWNTTSFLAASGQRSTDNYAQRFRSWAICLTDKQVSTL